LAEKIFLLKRVEYGWFLFHAGRISGVGTGEGNAGLSSVSGDSAEDGEAAAEDVGMCATSLINWTVDGEVVLGAHETSVGI